MEGFQTPKEKERDGKLTDIYDDRRFRHRWKTVKQEREKTGRQADDSHTAATEIENTQIAKRQRQADRQMAATQTNIQRQTHGDIQRRADRQRNRKQT